MEHLCNHHGKFGTGPVMLHSQCKVNNTNGLHFSH